MGNTCLGGQLSWGNTCPGGPLVQGDNCPGGQMSGGQMSGGRLSGGQMSHHHNFCAVFFVFLPNFLGSNLYPLLKIYYQNLTRISSKLTSHFIHLNLIVEKNLYFNSFYILNCRDFDFWPKLPPFVFFTLSSFKNILIVIGKTRPGKCCKWCKRRL